MFLYILDCGLVGSEREELKSKSKKEMKWWTGGVPVYSGLWISWK